MLYFKVLPIVFLLSCIWILPQPRYYNSSVMVAPENSGDMEGGLSSIASSFGLNIGAPSSDAIYPMLYPDLFESYEFRAKILAIKIHFTDSDNNEHHTDYYTYLSKHQKKNWLTYPFKATKSKILEFFSPDESSAKRAGSIDILDYKHLSYKDDVLMTQMGELIRCDVDKKTDVTTITVTDQDASVAAEMADSVRLLLQHYITNYRTSKARLDYTYYSELSAKAKKEYDKAVEAYSRFCDSHQEVSLLSYSTQGDKLENEMQARLQAYQTMQTQVLAAESRIQEKTPAFTLLQPAVVPPKPAGPKRMFFVAVMLFLAFAGTTIYILGDIIKEKI